MSDHFHSPRSGIALLALLLGIAALVALILAPIGYKQGWWDYGYALQSVIKYSAFAATAAAFLAIMGLGHTWFGSERRGMLMSLIALALAVGTLSVPVKQLIKFKSLPVIHDISTDTDNPPALEASVAIRGGSNFNSTAYEGQSLANAQSCAYESIAPLISQKDPETAYPIALELVKQRGWELLATDSRRGRIEAVDTSRWFGFKDDIVIRIRRAENNSNTVIDMRSSSRSGQSDLGVNAARIETFLRDLKTALGS